MALIKINLPDKFAFSTQLPVRITDINYGGHLGNDAVLSIIHEIRMRFLKSIGYTELEFSGVGLIMADVNIQFKSESFYGDEIIASVGISDISSVGFDLCYLLEIEEGGKRKTIAIAKTAMICFDYKARRIAKIPAEANAIFLGFK